METENRYTIRLCQAADGATIQSINHDGAPGVSPLTSTELVGLAAGAVRCWVADDGGQAVGYLITYTNTDSYDGEEFAWFRQNLSTFLYVDQIAIAASHRRQGVGVALYQRAIEDARGQGVGSLACEVNLDPPNPSSLAFHRGVGFVSIGELHTADGRFVTLLRKPLVS